MSKLHIYRVVRGNPSQEADGDGDASSEFDVTITRGKVSKGVTYQIRQGTSTVGDSYACTSGAGKGGTARFKKS